MTKYKNASLPFAQNAVQEWSKKNFKRSELGVHSLLGVVEEVGELAHSHLKQLQGIRGAPAEHEAKGKDAVGDILIYLLDYCEQRGWSMQQILDETLTTVLARDWTKNQQNGVPD